MKKILTITGLLVLFLTGCAGTNFVQPDSGKLALGKTGKAEAIQIMGSKPMVTGEVIINDVKIEQVKYAYASTGGEPAYSGVVPARALSLSFYQDILVAKEFTSSFKADSSDFDSDLVAKIEKGKTTRAEVIALLGLTTGEAIFPVIKSKEDKAIIYSYGQAKGNVFNMKFYTKTLIISFDNSDIVTDIAYTSTGTK